MTDAPQKGKADTSAQDEATQKLLSSLGDRVAQSPYNKVAPAFQNGLDGQKTDGQPGQGRDKYYTPPEGQAPPTHGRYGPSGTLYPGAGQNNGNQPNGNGEVPDFKKAHQDQQVDPNKPYARNPIGDQAAQELKNGGKRPPERQYSWQGGDFFDARVQQTIAMRGQYTDLKDAVLFGAAATIPIPAIHGVISRAADKAVVNAGENKTLGGSLGKWWQNNADPAKSPGDLIKPDQKYEAAFKDFNDLKVKLAEEAKVDGDLGKAAKEKLAFLEERSATLKPAHAMEAKVSGNFSAEELKVIEGRITAEGVTNAAAKKEAGRLATLMENSPSWMKRMGVGVGGTVMTYSARNLDQSITRKIAGEEGVHESWNLSQLATPMAFAAMPGKWKLAAPVVGVLSSQIVDGLARTTGITAPDRWNAATGVFDGWNGASLAGSLTLATYAKNPWAKLAIAGAGTLLPIAVHAYQDNIGGNLKGKTEAARESVQEDHTERSYSSLKHVDSAMTKVLDKKEDWVAANVDASFAAMNQKWDKLAPEQRLLALRDDASTTGALSRNILEKGTRISDRSSEPDYMLGGYQLDVGGRALHYMLRTRNSADKAAQLTAGIINDNQNHPDQQITVKGALPTKQEVDDLKKYSADAQEDINKILDGKHDVRGAFDELVHKAEVLDKEFLKTYVKAPDRLILFYNEKGAKAKEVADKAAAEGNEALRQQATDKMTEYAKVVGKLYRDEAIAYMAMAAAKNKNGHDGGGSYDLLIDDGTNHKDIFETTGQRKGYNGAQGALKMAENYSPDNPDMPALDKIFAETAAKMNENKLLQLTDSKTNILGYHDNFRRPGS